MEEIALYRKYRPHNFDNLVGQDHIKGTLLNAFKTERVSHAYLFSGPRGTGKTSTARLIAKALNCTDLKDHYDPCNECDFCNDINAGSLIDIIEIDAASNRGIDEVRDLKEKINFAPTKAKYKIYIIDEVHMMTKEAFNALLKTLEEPPAHAYFILATTEIHKIPETIISRCQRFDFKRITNKALLTRLTYIAQLEKIEAEDQALEAISRYVDGGMRDAIGLVEQLTIEGKLTFAYVKEVLGISDAGIIIELYDTIANNDVKAAFKIIHDLHDQGTDLKKFVHEFVDSLRTRMLEDIAQGNNGNVSKYVKMIEVFQDAQLKLNLISVPQLPLEIAVIRLTTPQEEFATEPEVPKAKEEEAKPRAHKKIEEKAVKKVEPVMERVPEIKEEKVVEAKEETVINQGELTLDSVIDNWPRILERIKAPSLKMSAKNALPVKINGSELTLQFGSNFHKDKVMEHDYRVELEKIIEEVTGSGAKILSIVKALEIKPVMEEEMAPSPSSPPESQDSGKSADQLNAALNIFGGEVKD